MLHNLHTEAHPSGADAIMAWALLVAEDCQQFPCSDCFRRRDFAGTSRVLRKRRARKICLRRVHHTTAANQDTRQSARRPTGVPSPMTLETAARACATLGKCWSAAMAVDKPGPARRCRRGPKQATLRPPSLHPLRRPTEHERASQMPQGVGRTRIRPRETSTCFPQP